MKDIAFTFIASGSMVIDKANDVRVTWAYHQTAILRLHEDTETWSCTKLGYERMSLNDLKRKLRYKFMAGSKAAVRRKYVEQLDAEQRAEKNIVRQSTDCTAATSETAPDEGRDTSP